LLQAKHSDLNGDDIAVDDTESPTIKEPDVPACNSSNSPLLVVSLENMYSFPKGRSSIKKKTKEKKKSVIILTSNPYKKLLNTDRNKKVAKEAATIAKRLHRNKLLLFPRKVDYDSHSCGKFH
jgi:hypothetical protein